MGYINMDFWQLLRKNRPLCDGIKRADMCELKRIVLLELNKDELLYDMASLNRDYLKDLSEKFLVWNFNRLGGIWGGFKVICQLKINFDNGDEYNWPKRQLMINVGDMMLKLNCPVDNVHLPELLHQGHILVDLSKLLKISIKFFIFTLWRWGWWRWGWSWWW